MKMSSLKLNTSHLTPNEEALLRCQRAMELKDRGEYEAAQVVMRPIWAGIGSNPQVEHLHQTVAAEVFLCVGVLTRWVGSRNRFERSQFKARDLISRSISCFESVGDVTKVAAARAELAYCYWREGALDEARIMFTESLQKLTTQGNTRANALLGLAVVEWSAGRFEESLKILTDNSSLFTRITNHSTRGAYHNQIAMLLRKLTPVESPATNLRKILKEYETADTQFRLARNVVFRADVKNNLGFFLYTLSRYKDAHACLSQARRLKVSVKDKTAIAQIDDTRAQVFIAEKKYKDAEATARGAVKILEKSGHQCLLADALITYGIALARMKQVDRAQFTFQRAIEVAHQVGALNKAGVAALTLLEELEELSPEASAAAYDRASEWLAKSQSQELLIRLNAAGRKVVERMRGKMKEEDSTAAIFNKPFDLHNEVLKFEANMIRQALAQSSGSVTRAASLLDMSYQGLAYVMTF